jgi:hypothetical protein
MMSDTKERNRIAVQKYRQAHPDRVRAATYRWRAAHPEEFKSYQKGIVRKRLYGITTEEYDALLLSQGNKCAICCGENLGNRDWNVDHDHNTNKVRGILCHSCNLLLGHSKDNPNVLCAAIAYLGRVTSN